MNAVMIIVSSSRLLALLHELQLLVHRTNLNGTIYSTQCSQLSYGKTFHSGHFFNVRAITSSAVLIFRLITDMHYLSDGFCSPSWQCNLKGLGDGGFLCAATHHPCLDQLAALSGHSSHQHRCVTSLKGLER